MAKLETILTFLALSAGVYIWYSMEERVFFLNPLIDTHLPQGFTQAGFDRIQHGMTEAEVLRLIPPPDRSSPNFCASDPSDETFCGNKGYAWRYGSDGAAEPWADFAWFQLTVQFTQDGRVKKKTQTAFYD